MSDWRLNRSGGLSDDSGPPAAHGADQFEVT